MGRSIRCCSWNDIPQVSFSTPTGWKYFVEDGSGIWFLWSAPFECACMHAIAWQDMGPVGSHKEDLCGCASCCSGPE
jgi:hypothetical protein